MCRLLAYQGPPLSVDDFLYKPDHSLINQSYNAHEIEEPLNGDGFGLGWYSPGISAEPAVFVSVSPSWNNRNLRYIAPKLASPTLFAHVRAASVGDVTENNCHPFHHCDMLMMHNGDVEDFGRIKRNLVDTLSQDRYLWISGQTDSQHLFALFLDHYLSVGRTGTAAMADALDRTFHDLKALKRSHGLNQASWLNIVVTDGKRTVASRYVDEPGLKPLSLHHTEGSRYVCDDSGCGMRPARAHKQAVLVASEPLTDNAAHWKSVLPNHFLMVDEENHPVSRPVRTRLSFSCPTAYR